MSAADGIPDWLTVGAVVAPDGTKDHLHQGRWPIGMAEDRRAQLQQGRDLFLRRERA